MKHATTAPATNKSRRTPLCRCEVQQIIKLIDCLNLRTSRRPKKQKRWNNPRSSYTSSGFIQSPNLRSLPVGFCTCTEPVFWRPSWISYQTADFVPSGKLKPVLNWANVCSPNILRTLRRTVILFLIELLVRRIWFGQSKLYFILNWLVMRCKLRPEHAADAQQTAWSKM